SGNQGPVRAGIAAIAHTPAAASCRLVKTPCAEPGMSDVDGTVDQADRNFCLAFRQAHQRRKLDQVQKGHNNPAVTSCGTQPEVYGRKYSTSTSACGGSAGPRRIRSSDSRAPASRDSQTRSSRHKQARETDSGSLVPASAPPPACRRPCDGSPPPSRGPDRRRHASPGCGRTETAHG